MLVRGTYIWARLLHGSLCTRVKHYFAPTRCAWFVKSALLVRGDLFKTFHNSTVATECVAVSLLKLNASTNQFNLSSCVVARCQNDVVERLC
jgi:hypothetical protein